jgi:hypothetical protein
MNIDEIQHKLADSRSRLSKVQHLARRLEEARQDRQGRQSKLKELGDQYRAEKKDVERLEGNSLSAVYHWVMNDSVETLERERDEMMEAKIRLDVATAEVEEIARREQALEQELGKLYDPEEEIADLEGKLAAHLKLTGTSDGNELLSIGVQDKDLVNLEVELEEALRAGARALRSLGAVARSLDSARSWGTWDMLGGGLIATYMKHEKMGKAQSGMVAARNALQAFDHELQDVDRMVDRDIELDGLTSFADYFFDGLLIDWVVQSKINKGRKAVAHACTDIRSILGDLDDDLAGVNEKRAALSARSGELLSGY